ncbi:MAG: VCBS repeat-containing protein [Saprospiraceae bacterium]|nr:VCBS repeat-containing protein [Saprospiraceae bacterium]
MHGTKFLLFGLSVVFLFYACGKKEKTLFQQLDPAETGIDFTNQITENDTFNILSYEYIYNGGGVGVGDFNNDGLQDLFFTGNMVGNKLYLNKGNFKFEDVTEAAGVSALDRWNTGIAVVDINNDGWLDLYVCASTHTPGSRRANSLFINNKQQGLPTFSEQAEAYNLADTTHTTNAAFFDYDNDGDLDCYLLINQMDKNAIPNRYRNKITDGTSHRTDKLLRNDPGPNNHVVFTDVSKEAGITIEGFGLGVNICDINRDGWKDVYVTNDYLTNDLFWINNGSNTAPPSPITFTDQAPALFNHTCHSAMGNDVVDLNNDALADIVAVDMLPEDNLRRKTMLPPNNYNTYLNNEKFGYQYQYVRNVLQVNQGSSFSAPPAAKAAPLPHFSETAMLAGISSTDWSWTPLVADFDSDGYRDIIITNGFPNDVTDRDFIDFNSEKGSFLTKDQLLKEIPSVKIKNYAYRNTTTHSTGKATPSSIPVFENVTQQWGITLPSFSNGAAYADLDNDGDLDYVVNNINDAAFVFKNTLVETRPDSTHWLKIKFAGGDLNRNGLGASVQIFYSKNQNQFWENTPYRGYLSSVESGAYFGLGNVTTLDSLVVTWQSEQPNSPAKVQVLTNVPANQVLALDIKNAAPRQQPPAKYSAPIFVQSAPLRFTHPESDYIDFNVQRLLMHKLSQYGPGMAVADINADGLDDFYVSGSHFNKGSFFIQKPDGNFEQKDLLPGPNGDLKREEELGVLFFDADNDGDQDLYLASGGYEFPISDTVYQDRLFVNDNGRFVPAPNALPHFLSSSSCVKAADFDRDGDLDLFVGGRVLPYEYPKPVSSYILRNDSQKGAGPKFTLANKEVAPALDDIGLICDALWTDYDNDGWQDLLLAGEWMPLFFLKNNKGKLGAPQSPFANLPSPAIGWWNSLVAADFDLDGDMDYVAGNLGLNTLLKATDERPIAVYAADFDINSTDPDNPAADLNQSAGYDMLPAIWFPDENGRPAEFPFFSRSDMDKQLTKVKKLYLYHKEYGKATMQEVLNNFPDVKPLVLKANYLKTSYLKNLGNGKFELSELPLQAQVAPVYGMITGDFNGDVFPDLLLTGNDYGAEVSMGRHDALKGLLLVGDGKGNFSPLPMQQSGICIPGDGKSMIELAGAGGEHLVVAGQNRGPLQVFSKAGSRGQQLSLKQMDCAAIVRLKDGRTYRVELPYGHSFLSQSARRLWLPEQAEEVEVIDFRGNRRQIKQ